MCLFQGQTRLPWAAVETENEEVSSLILLSGSKGEPLTGFEPTPCWRGKKEGGVALDWLMEAQPSR